MNEMKESAVIKSAFENRLGVGLVKHTMQTNPAVDRVKLLDGPWVHGISPVGKKRSMD